MSALPGYGGLARATGSLAVAIIVYSLLGLTIELVVMGIPVAVLFAVGSLLPGLLVLVLGAPALGMGAVAVDQSQDPGRVPSARRLAAALPTRPSCSGERVAVHPRGARPAAVRLRLHQRKLALRVGPVLGRPARDRKLPNVRSAQPGHRAEGMGIPAHPVAAERSSPAPPAEEDPDLSRAADRAGEQRPDLSARGRLRTITSPCTCPQGMNGTLSM